MAIRQALSGEKSFFGIPERRRRCPAAGEKFILALDLREGRLLLFYGSVGKFFWGEKAVFRPEQ